MVEDILRGYEKMKISKLTHQVVEFHYVCAAAHVVWQKTHEVQSLFSKVLPRQREVWN